jgi:hypothetical protein
MENVVMRAASEYGFCNGANPETINSITGLERINGYR